MISKMLKSFGGGERFARFPVFVAVACMILLCALTATPSSAEAANDDGHDLYLWNGEQISRIEVAGSKKGLKFTAIHRNTNYTCLTGVDGKTYEYSSRATDGKIFLNKTVGSCDPVKNPPRAITGHSARESATYEEVVEGGKTVIDVSVDADGRAWVQKAEETTGTVPGSISMPSSTSFSYGPSVIQGTDDIEFFGIATLGGSPVGEFLLIGSPRNTATSRYAGQLPQSGDPAAGWMQAAPYVVAVFAVTGAAATVSMSKRRV